MKSTLGVAIQCPYCKQPMGYYFTRDGMIYNNEIVGRFGGNSIQCVNCQNRISIMIHFRYDKTKKQEKIK